MIKNITKHQKKILVGNHYQFLSVDTDPKRIFQISCMATGNKWCFFRLFFLKIQDVQLRQQLCLVNCGTVGKYCEYNYLNEKYTSISG